MPRKPISELNPELELHPSKMLINFIEHNFNGNKAEFARAQGVKPQQVSQWLAKGFIVVDGVMYSPRRELKATKRQPTMKNSITTNELVD